MLLNTFEFILVFLPLSLLAYYAVAAVAPSLRLWVLLAFSVGFYSLWAWADTGWLLLSIAANFGFGVAITRLRANRRAALAALTAAIVLNLLYLAWFKYAKFLVESAMGVDWNYIGGVLPLGISFFTFTQIMFLVDLYRREAQPASPLLYGTFVTFYPHLPAGPLYHYSEVMPQLGGRSPRPVWDDLTVGWTIFVFGLAKKGFADLFAPMADAAFATGQADMTTLTAWTGAIAYSFQLYFDFSGYSDMAIGVARMFGVVFPENFRSPYKALSIVDFWRRWHMTLSRFLRDYLYIPLGGNRHGEPRRLFNLMVTMLLGGLWHGANWTFVVWGGLHGVFLCIDRLWRKAGLPTLPAVPAMIVTFIAVTFAWVLFRADTLLQAFDMMAAMLGLGAPFGTLPGIQWHANPVALAAQAPVRDGALLLAGFVIAWAAPNTQAIMHRAQPVLARVAEMPRIAWRPTLGWMMAVALLFALAATQISAKKVFLYWNF